MTFASRCCSCAWPTTSRNSATRHQTVGPGHPDSRPWCSPNPTDYGLTAQTDPRGFTVWDGERVAEYRAARTRALALHVPTDQPRIPIHKLSGHDGWIVTVTRGECAQALAAYRRHRTRGQPHPPAFGDGFITFLTACANGDGFLVT